MLEITGDDIARLNDTQLREVVARLCESELRQRGISAVHLTSGGHQDAADGGIDVRVQLPDGIVIDGFVPRGATGFQVKAQDMPRTEIRNEMKPHGLIRPAIQNLASEGGAYVIVSSQGSATDTALDARRAAMREAVRDVPNSDRLGLDFYDRARLATWVRQHPGLIPWVRALVGRAIVGWQSHGSWASPTEALTGSYIVDEKARVYSSKGASGQGLSVVNGINAIRNELRQPQRSVRLVGLSGVGKTRLVQALFDDRIGTGSLDPTLALYTNTTDEPVPHPVGLAADLAAASLRAVLVIDNCPSDLHRRLSDVCQSPASRLSLLTVEYDIQDDVPESTEVYKLESSSPKLIEELLLRRFPQLSAVDRDTIAATDFCGGNARIAIALAQTVQQRGALVGLSDNGLFESLFHQRHPHDPSLLASARAGALVYSFDGEDLSSPEGELVRLGTLSGQSPHELCRNVAELLDRDLAQRRGVWRAILPHPIANKLAARGLREIPQSQIESELFSSERLLRSFSRRLGYLHGSDEALAIVRQWLGPDGLLSDVGDLSELGRAIFRNIAPVAPEECLASIEKALRSNRPDAALRCKEHCELLRSLAYDQALFERASKALATILAGEPRSESRSLDIFTSLFHLYLSGTHAPVEMRMAVIESLLATGRAAEQALAVRAFGALLSAGHFMAVGGFDFGAQSRNFGYWPRTREEVQDWFNQGLKLGERLGSGDTPVAHEVRIALAERLRGLWLYGTNRNDVARVCGSIALVHSWPEGWRAIRETLNLHGEGMPEGEREILHDLERELRPTNIVDKVRAILLVGSGTPDIDDSPDQFGGDVMERVQRVQARSRDLGMLVGADDASLRTLLPEVVATRGQLLWFFGEGLALGTNNPEQLWGHLVGAFASAEDSVRTPEVLRGFLAKLSESQRSLVESLLDEAVNHEALGSWYPRLQDAVAFQTPDVLRLKRSLTERTAPGPAYSGLTYVASTDQLSAADLGELILAIADLPSGYDVALEILSMRLHVEKSDVSSEMIAVGRELLQRLEFTHNNRQDIRLEEVARKCLAGEDGARVAFQVCARLKGAVKRYETSAIYHDDLLFGVISVQPVAALDALCAGMDSELKQGLILIHNASGKRAVISVVPAAILLEWCDRDPAIRYLAMAGQIIAWDNRREHAPPQWTPLAREFLKRAPNADDILHAFVVRFDSRSGFIGARDGGIERNALLLDELDDLPQLRGAIQREKEWLREEIAEVRRLETAINRGFSERFE